MTSATATGTITRETEAPVAQDTVVEVWDEKTKTWKAVPKSTDASGLVTHTFYAGDKLRFTTKFTDNSDKIANTVVRQGQTQHQQQITSYIVLGELLRQIISQQLHQLLQRHQQQSLKLVQ